MGWSHTEDVKQSLSKEYIHKEKESIRSTNWGDATQGRQPIIHGPQKELFDYRIRSLGSHPIIQGP